MKVLVTGASSQIGSFLLPLLTARGDACIAVSRKPRPDIDGVQWITADLTDEASRLWHQLDCQAWIHLAFLPLALPHFRTAAASGIKQFVGFSSTSIYTKIDSESLREQAVIGQLKQAEASVASVCEALDMGWTILRPTLIYGHGSDQNIAFIASMVKQFGFFPLAGSGEGLRQPVHAGDLAAASVAALGNERARNRAYNLSGGERLSYRDMVVRVFESLDKQPRLLHCPTQLLKMAMQLLRLFPAYRHLNGAMIDRMQLDMAFDHADAAADLDYRPRRFDPQW